MPLVPGLNPAVRLEDDPAEGAISPMDVTVEQAGDEPDVPEFDQSGAILRIDHGDGSITVSLDGKPISDAEGEDAGHVLEARAPRRLAERSRGPARRMGSDSDPPSVAPRARARPAGGSVAAWRSRRAVGGASYETSPDSMRGTRPLSILSVALPLETCTAGASP